MLFVLSLAGLSKQETARRGNVARHGRHGARARRDVALALRAAPSGPSRSTASLILVVLLVGATVGTWQARRVEMTQMPELIAILHSFVGARGGARRLQLVPHRAGATRAHLVEVFLGVLIGAVTFTGSIVAYLKLSTRIGSAPLVLPGRNWLNLAMVAGVRRAAGVVPRHRRRLARCCS